MKKQLGFTIVELIIVIVVIGILAAISIATYSGVQQKARNTQMITAASTYQKAISLYAAEEGSYPTFGEYAVCLGDGYPDGRCWIGPNGNFSVNSAFDNMIKTVLSQKPVVYPKYYQATSVDTRSGIVYYRNNPSGRVSIEYALDGSNQPCQLNGATIAGSASNGFTRCMYTFPLL